MYKEHDSFVVSDNLRKLCGDPKKSISRKSWVVKTYYGQKSHVKKKKSKNIQSLKQNLKKRVMEYKTMNNINTSNRNSAERVAIDVNAKPRGRCIPVSKPVNNCPGSKLPCYCKKFTDLNISSQESSSGWVIDSYKYCTKSYKWLTSAFSPKISSEFNISKCSELSQLLKAYKKCSEIELEIDMKDQISRDIVRTFPNNSYFSKDNTGYFAMLKVLSAYSNLDELMTQQKDKKLNLIENYDSESDDTISTITGTWQRGNKRSYKKTKNKESRNALIESFWEISFTDSTEYVQGMNFIVGILWYHLSPELAFCLFVKLMKDYDLEDNYAPGLSGFKLKSETLNDKIIENLPELHYFFVSFTQFN